MAEFTEEDFIDLVKRSELAAEQDIKSYKFKLALFALLGYFVIFFSVFCLIALVGGTIGIALVSSSLFLLLIKKKLIFVILFAIWTFLKALWVKFEKPTGHVLKRGKYPELFGEIDALSKTLDALKIHQVIIEDNLNAAVVQHPKYGLLGGQRNTLYLGIQLLLALPADEMRSVLAHEFGHLSGNHSRFSAWIYRVRLSWQRIMHAFDDNNSFGAGLMRRFFSWYAPKFSAYSFALARRNEYEADQVAAELTTPNTAAKALVSVYAQAPYIDKEYWDWFFQQADQQAEPSVAPYAGLADFLKQNPISRADLLANIKQQMQQETHYTDTHPALKDRVEAITDAAVIPGPFEKSAAEQWLGESYRELLNHFDHMWLADNAEKWRQRYDYVCLAKQVINANRDSQLGDLPDDELWDLSLYRDEFDSPQAALTAFNTYQQRYPDSIGAAYYVGRILAQQEDENALTHLRKALRGAGVFEEVGHWGYQLLEQKGKQEAAESWWQEVVEASEAHHRAAVERSNVSIEDEFIEPTIEPELEQKIVEVLKQHSNAGASWLAEKVLHEPDQNPVYIVAFRPRGFYFSFEAAMEAVASELPGDANIFVVSLWGDTKKLAKQVRKAGVKIV